MNHTQHIRLVIARPPCEWCSSPYRPKTATVETATTVGGASARLCDDCADTIGTGLRVALVDAAKNAPLLTANSAAAYVATETWTYAKSVPNEPHEYLLLARSTDPATHLRVIRYIRETGERRRWARDRRWYHYWPEAGHEYWAMGDSETMLNRRVITP
jgi:hypothetical protein